MNLAKELKYASSWNNTISVKMTLIAI